jgi:hypothetical protein
VWVVLTITGTASRQIDGYRAVLDRGRNRRY